MPISRRRPPLPLRTSSEPRLGSRSRSPSDSASATQAAAPEHDHESAEPVTVGVVADLAQHGDDLFHGRRVGGIEPPLVAGRTSGVVAGHGRRRATPTGRHRARRARSWDLLPIAQRTEPARLPVLPHPRQAHRAFASPWRCGSQPVVNQTAGSRPIRASVGAGPDARSSRAMGERVGGREAFAPSRQRLCVGRTQLYASMKKELVPGESEIAGPSGEGGCEKEVA
jgi:hypothetical protein